MRIAILDPFAGISGDMTLGCLVDAGLEPGWLEGLPERLGLTGVGVRLTRVTRCSVAATKVDFVVGEPPGHAGHGRSIGRLVELVGRASVSDTAREKAVRAFRALGVAEGRIHGVDPNEVHLHEVGAVDAVLDIVGAIEGFELLGVDAVYNLPVAVGDGWAHGEHGALPVPAPATLELLSGFELRLEGPVRGEAATPTGAALLGVLSQGPPPSTWRQTATAWGAGSRDPEDYPNALRLILGEAAVEAGMVDVVATDIDDLAPEYIEPMRAAILRAGAVDCVAWATHGKKGRVSLRVEFLAPPGRTERAIEALFANSTTSGVRRWRTVRTTLTRREMAVELGGSKRVRVKVWDGPEGVRVKPEYEDVVQVAGELALPALEVARRARQRAETELGDGDRSSIDSEETKRRD